MIYSGRDTARSADEQRRRQGADKFHRRTARHRLAAEDEGDALIRAWRQLAAARD